MLNGLLLILWSVGLGILSYNMAHTILTACSTEYWANSTGMNVCRMYKALFAFTVSGCASYVSAVALDVIVRRRQTRLGAYGLATTGFAPGEDSMEAKLTDPRDDSNSGIHTYDAVPAPVAGIGGHGPYNNSAFEHGHAGEAQQYYDDAPVRSRRGEPRVRFSSYEQGGYQHPPEQTGYDPVSHR